jgi:ribonuclease HII
MFDAYKPDVVFVFDGASRGLGARLDYCTGAMPKADVLVPAVAAASVVAKTRRDAVMRLMAEQYPAYGLAQSAGYGTKAHRAALAEHGLCPEHRRSYEPMRSMVERGRLGP